MRETGKEILEFCNEYLRENGGSIASLCRKAGIKPEVIGMWKVRGDSNPKISTLISLSEAMGMTVSELIGQTGYSEKPYSDSVLEFARMESLLTDIEVKSVLTVAKTFYDAHLGKKREVI